MKDSNDTNQRLPEIVGWVSLISTLIMLIIVTGQVYKSSEVFQIPSIQLGLRTLASVALIFLVLYKVARRASAVLIIPFLFCAYTGHALAALAWGVFCIASFGLGSFVYGLRGAKDDSPLGPALPFAKLFVGISLNSFLTWIAMHFSVNFPENYWIFYGAEIIFFSSRGALFGIKPPLRLEPGQWVILLHALLFMPYAVVPSYNFDDISSHLFIAHQTRLFGQFLFTPELVSGLNPSMLPMGAYTSTFMLGGESSMRLLNLSMYTFGFLTLESFIRHRWGARLALFTILFAVVTPFTHWTLGICFVDSFFFAFSTLFFVCSILFLSSRDLVILPWLGLLAGLGYLAKQQFIFIAIPLALPICMTLARSLAVAPRRCLVFTSVASLVFLVTIAPPLVHNYILTGNPLFPFYNSLFKSPYWPSQDLVDRRWNQPFSLRTLWTITFHGSRFVENSDFSFGFAPLVLLPAILCIGAYRATKCDRWILLTLLLSVAYTYLCFSTTGLYIRYFVGLIAPLSLCMALTVHHLLSQGRAVRWLASLSITALIGGNLAALLSGRNTAEPYPIVEAFTQSFNHSSMAYHARFKTLFDQGLNLCGKASTGLLIDSPAHYFAQTRLVSNLWHFTRVNSGLSGAKSPEALKSLIFDDLKACYIIMPLRPSGSGVRSAVFRDFLTQIGETADFGLFVRKEHPEGQSSKI